MSRGGSLAIVAGVAALLLMAVGLSRVFQLRFEIGDSYPESSSYRADPKGCKAYYEALASVPGLSVERNLMPLPMLEIPIGDATLFFLGAIRFPFDRGGWKMPDATVTRIETLAQGGTRIVFALSLPNPVRADAPSIKSLATAEDDADPNPADGEAEDGDLAEALGADPLVSMDARWGFVLAHDEVADRPEGGWGVSGHGELAEVDLPAWSDPWRLVGLDDAWQTLASIDGNAIAIERRFGRGAIVLVADSYFASNQALLGGESTGMLAWLPGGRDRVIFDETHLGTEAAPGVMALVARYRLQGFFVGVALLIVVFAWKNSRGLVPPDKAGEGRLYEDATVMGSGATEGMNRMLRRHLGTGGLLETCYRTWFASGARSRRFTRSRADEVIGLIEADKAKKPRRREVLGTYNRIIEILSRKGGI
ncbi:hypothetical protein BH23VER1_BH23VER1_30070 [soil metagenome]